MFVCVCVQDYVVKQGLTSNQADMLLSSLTTAPHSYHAAIALLYFSKLVSVARLSTVQFEQLKKAGCMMDSRKH